MKKVIAILILFVLVVSYSVILYAHPGRTDANGGHYNLKTGGYHDHNLGGNRPLPARESRFLNNAPGTLVKLPDNKKPVQKQLDRKKSLRQQLEDVEKRLGGVEQHLDEFTGRLGQLEYKVQQLSPVTKSNSATESNQDKESLGIGETGYLRTEHLTLAIDKKAHDELLSAVLAKDKVGYDQLVLSGRAFIVPNKAKIRVIDRGLFIRKVRILDGPLQGFAGWTAFEDITK